MRSVVESQMEYIYKNVQVALCRVTEMHRKLRKRTMLWYEGMRENKRSGQ